MKLSLYNKKRNFKKTPEPAGKVSHKNKHLYVIQKHAASHLHYDLRLELNGVLLSWAVPKGPCLDPSVKRLAIHVEDHPVEYGHFEGIIPKGEYGGGTVMLWDEGLWIPQDDPIAGYKKGHLKFLLKAKKLQGMWNLVRLKKDEKAWFLIKAKDEYARPLAKYDVTIKEPKSVLSHYDMDEITENYKDIWSSKEGLKKKRKKSEIKKTKIKIDLKPGRMPSVIYPQLATLVNQIPTGNEWVHEVKFDGYRIVAFKDDKKIKLMSRNNKEWTEHFSNVADAIKKLPVKKIILDGEMVLLDKKNKSNFQLLQNSIGSSHPFIYYVFDILYYDKYKLTSLNLIERKNILKQIIDTTNKGFIRYSDHIMGNGPEILKNACKMQLEGIISKQINSNYEENKRTKTWLKSKCNFRQEFVIGGYSPPQGSRMGFGSLYLGYYDKNGNLQFCGNVGTGFNQESLQKILAKLKKITTIKNPFTTKPPGVTTAIWVKPKLIAEVEFTEWTSEGSLRHPSFKGLRTDKPVTKITRESKAKLTTIEKAKEVKLITKKIKLPVRLTHPDKILYPEAKITKLDLANYYETIQEWILPYIVNRPLTLVRCPENYKACFYQKHINKSTPDSLLGIKIKEKIKTENYIYIKDSQGLLDLVQMSTLELHPWGSRIEDVEHPDMIIIDLDPAPDVEWKKVVLAAKRIQQYFKELNLTSFVKTTGGKGLHVVIPIRSEYNWEQVKNFTHAFVNLMVEQYPNEYVSQMSKLKRKGKIFIDYLRNSRGATAVSAYSTRARPNAPVSVPLHWDELTNNIKDASFTINTVTKRLANLKNDPWKDFYKIKQKLRLDKLKK